MEKGQAYLVTDLEDLIALFPSFTLKNTLSPT